MRCAVSPSGDTLCITRHSQPQILTIARDGTFLAIYADPELLQPEGVHVTPSGQVLVGGYLSCTILQVDVDGRTKPATLAHQKDGVRRQESVCYSSTTSSIIV
ncbi:hypothetical protein DPMN_147747 [Dreissena polymorpha]|uniref:Uncharacterized protein n=1 Tax=Dreissena polymorpha TaxID=45954 RepID=A0A9D4FCR9_DREPO|nr:hypothetical protein DPMN_147747 [Dreissena polymorpha]